MQSNFHFFGPESRYSHALEYNNPSWGWPGSALTASTNWLPFAVWSGAPIKWANLTVVWWPLSSAGLRFLHFDGGPINETVIAEMHVPDRPPENPIPSRVEITPEMEVLRRKGTNKYFGYQLQGHVKIGAVLLDIAFDSGADTSPPPDTDGTYEVLGGTINLRKAV